MVDEETLKPERRCKAHPEADIVFELTPKLQKHGRWNCEECGKLIQWAITPKTNKEMTERQEEIRKMVADGVTRGMTDKELHKLLKLYNKTHIGVDKDWYVGIKMGRQV